MGPCRGTFKRWYYDPRTQRCQEFYFGGCRGNSNNFIKHEDCVKRCHEPGHQQHQHQQEGEGEDVFLNDEFRSALDVLVKQRRRETAESMTEGFMELEEQRQTVARLEAEEREAATRGAGFSRAGELGGARKKLMMMEKHRMMSSQMMMFKQKQRMLAKQKMMMTHSQQQQMFTPPPVRVPTNVSQHEVSSQHWNDKH